MKIHEFSQRSPAEGLEDPESFALEQENLERLQAPWGIQTYLDEDQHLHIRLYTRQEGDVWETALPDQAQALELLLPEE